MASLIDGFEYDVFISYRHNDNRSGWVTDFVNALQEELAATIKEPLSIYFDKNPHDGLLETHSVDKSLEGKLKCLIFIPILSQTYCDSKSFAWQHEFCAFNKLAGEDRLGRDIRLRNGNVASRILPVKIHDLEVEDKAGIEQEIGGALRAIEFIYREPGVNRPLKPSDRKAENLNKTDYQNQVNKTAHAIKEIIAAMKSGSEDKQGRLEKVITQPSKKVRRAGAITAIGLFLISLAGYWSYPLFIPEDSEVEKSIAVLPFVNMSNDPEQEYFSDGLSEELLNVLAKIPELKVIGRTSSFSFKGKNEDLRSIGQKLEVCYILEGSVRKSGNTVRITAQMVETENGSHLWSETFDRQLVDIFSVQDEIANQVVGQLRLRIPGLARAHGTANPEAYNLYLESLYVGQKQLPGFREKQIELLERAVAIDSTDARLWAELAEVYSYWSIGTAMGTRAEQVQRVRSTVEKALRLEPNLAKAHYVLGRLYLDFYWDWAKAEASFKRAEALGKEYLWSMAELNMTLGKYRSGLAQAEQALETDRLNATKWEEVGWFYLTLGDPKKAQEYVERAIELNPNLEDAYLTLCDAYLLQGDPEKALSSLDQVKDKNFNRSLFRYSHVYWLKGDTAKSNDYLRRLLESDRQADNAINLADVYALRGDEDEAFRWLEVAYERRHPALRLLKIFWGFRALQGPRKEALLRKMNLPLENPDD
jgi:TolB-like protein/Tfp pilus assembly protein PilF